MDERNARAKQGIRRESIVMEGLRTVDKLDDTELRRAYVVAVRAYNNAYRTKKEIEEEMARRFEAELEENRK